jgi:transcriptional regulator with XRE-family HTH domain
MRSDDPRADQWRAALAAALDASPLTQADLSRLIDRKPQQVSDWVAGRAGPPRPDTVFDIEDALGCPDRLSQILGFVRARPVDTETVIGRDVSLDDVDRATLLRMYRLMAGR